MFVNNRITISSKKGLTIPAFSTGGPVVNSLLLLLHFFNWKGKTVTEGGGGFEEGDHPPPLKIRKINLILIKYQNSHS